MIRATVVSALLGILLWPLGCTTLRSGIKQDEGFLRTRPLVVAHRGLSWEAPENTLAAYRLAIKAGAEMAECDVHLSREGTPVLMHDETLDRTTNGKGKVSDWAVAGLKTLDAGSWKGPQWAGEAIPTLEEALNLVRGKLRLIVEIKGPDMAAAVVSAIRNTGVRPGDLIIFSFYAEAVQEIARLEPRLPTVFLIHELPADKPARHLVLDKALSARVQGVGVWRRRVDAAFIRMAHERGLMVYVYTVNVTDDMEKLIQWGVDAVITDRPNLALELLE